MKHTVIEVPEVKLIGIHTRTNNNNEADAQTARIGPCVMEYFHKQLFNQIPSRATPGITYCAYTGYESDQHGDYTYFVGEKVDNFDDVPEGFIALTIPSQTYAKFTTNKGPMPDVLIQVWKHIWGLSEKDMGGKRSFQADFELYDQRASDHTSVEVDVFIGIEE